MSDQAQLNVNSLKIESSIRNATAFLEIQKSHGSFSDYIWSFVDGKTLINHFKELKELPAKTETSDKMSKELKSVNYGLE